MSDSSEGETRLFRVKHGGGRGAVCLISAVGPDSEAYCSEGALWGRCASSAAIPLLGAGVTVIPADSL